MQPEPVTQEKSSWLKPEDRESGSDLDCSSSGSSSDPNQSVNDGLSFEKRYEFRLMADLYRICLKIEKDRLQTKLGERGSLQFKSPNVLEVRFNDEAVKEEVRKFIYSMTAIPFERKQLTNRIDLLLHCKMLKEELNLSQYHIIKMQNNELSIYGVIKKKEEVKEKKELVLNSYMEVRYSKKPRFSQTEKHAYQTIFERLRNFETLVKKSDEVIKLEPYFRPEFRDSRKCTLKFFVKLSKKGDFKKLEQEISDEIANCRYLILVLDKIASSDHIKKSKKYVFRCFRDQKASINYGIIAFRKKEYLPEDLGQLLKRVCEDADVNVLGYRYFLDALDRKLKIQDFEEIANSMGFVCQPFPSTRPYSVTFYLKAGEQSFNDSERFIMELAIYGKVKFEKVNTSKILGDVSTIQPANSITFPNRSSDFAASSMAILDKSQPTVGYYAEEKGSNEQLFIEKVKNRVEEVIGEHTYSKTPIECSKAFLEIYNSHPDKQKEAIITGIPIGVLTRKNISIYSEQIEAVPIEQFKSEKKYFKGYYKPNTFATENHCYAIRPVFKYEWINKTSKIERQLQN